MIEQRNKELVDVITNSRISPIIITQNEVIGLVNRVKTYNNVNGASHQELLGTNKLKAVINGTPEFSDIGITDTITFNPKRTVIATSATVSAIINSNVDIIEHIKQLAIDAYNEKLEEEMLETGYGLVEAPTQLQKVFAAKDVKVVKTEFFGTDSPTEGRIGTLDREELEHALALVERNSKSGELTFVLDRSVASVTNGNSTSIITHANKLPKSAGRLFEHPAYRKTMSGNNEYAYTPAIVFDKDAIGASISEIKITVVHGDSSTVVDGTVNIIIEVFQDIKVINPKGIVALGYDNLAGVEPVAIEAPVVEVRPVAKNAEKPAKK